MNKIKSICKVIITLISILAQQSMSFVLVQNFAAELMMSRLTVAEALAHKIRNPYLQRIRSLHYCTAC
jgi:hypothetical protein